MVDASCEVNLRRLEGIVGREVDGEEEDTAGVGRIALSSDVSIETTRIHDVLSRHVVEAVRHGMHASVCNLQVP